MLKISRQPDGRPEVFHSIQGEGLHAGRPAVFLRLALCNLACVWCDTRYTWDWEHFDQGREVTTVSVDEAEREIRRYHCHSLVVTGGEPLVQQKPLTPLLECLKGRGFWIEIETNGTIVPGRRLLDIVDHWSVSPKLENSGNPRPSRENPDAYRLFRDLTSAHFKYVLEKADDLSELRALMHRYEIPSGRIILMPQAQDRDTLLDRSRWLVDLCKSEGYLFSTRLQILLWGNRRGV
ncbi:MAG TPA: 7-carboxy-7-deazaguanine synthase QueE [Dehalococcoidia bacterium]|nr:7-carboxy-7-deazaguanine synthase QueE [Dehalococcoidia bacterium]